MRVERLGGDKIRFFLTLDDLVDRGIEKEDMWRDIPKVHELFHDMMEHAYHELGFEVTGTVAVEVFTLPAQGMVVVVTRGHVTKTDRDELEVDEDMYELEVTMEEADDIIFRFNDLEDLVQASLRLKPYIIGGKVYFYNDAYYLVYSNNVRLKELNAVIAILTEFGESSTTTPVVLAEYGKVIFTEDAITQMVKYFN